MGTTPERSQFGVHQYDAKTNDLLTIYGQDFTSCSEVYESFDAMELCKDLLRGIYACGFKNPSAIQQRGIVPFCKGLDVIQQAQPGTGITVTLCSGILQRLVYSLYKCQALVLSPTRERALKIVNVLQALGRYMGLEVHAAIGATSICEDVEDLSYGFHVIVGTPACVLDALLSPFTIPDYIRIFVLDDADEMLAHGCKDQVHDIFRLLPWKIQVGFFSATMPPELLDFASKFMYRPVLIIVKRDELVLKNISQFYINVKKEQRKIKALFKLCKEADNGRGQAIIFVNTRNKVGELTEKIRRKGHTVSGIHENMDQSNRDAALYNFRFGSSRILITTDLLMHYLRMHGIDIQQVSFVINYDLPRQQEIYRSRIGYSGNFGCQGLAVNFVVHGDLMMLLENFYNTEISELPSDMAGIAPKDSQFAAHQYDAEMNDFGDCTLSATAHDFFTMHDEICDSFDSMGLNDNILRGIYEYGFDKPSVIQQRGIIPFIRGSDVIQQARCGIRRTATFCPGILQQLEYKLVRCQALVLVPTQEHAHQVEKVMRALGFYLGVKVHSCVGGIGCEDQKIHSSGVHVVVGTPDCVFDMLQRQLLYPDHIKIFVLDDADEMLSRGFKYQIYNIFRLLPSKLQVGLFSAAMPPEALEIAQKFMNKPVRILVKLIFDDTKQYYINVKNEEQKLEFLCNLYENLNISQSIFFVNTRLRLDWLTDKMRSLDHVVSAIHEDLDWNTRDTIMREFRSGSSRVLITTDIAYDIDVQVSLVVNFDLPSQPEIYLQRIGSRGCFGRKCVAINFVTCDDERILHDIQRFHNIEIKKFPSDHTWGSYWNLI